MSRPSPICKTRDVISSLRHGVVVATARAVLLPCAKALLHCANSRLAKARDLKDEVRQKARAGTGRWVSQRKAPPERGVVKHQRFDAKKPTTIRCFLSIQETASAIPSVSASVPCRHQSCSRPSGGPRSRRDRTPNTSGFALRHRRLNRPCGCARVLARSPQVPSHRSW